jgi:hypothetical protein
VLFLLFTSRGFLVIKRLIFHLEKNFNRYEDLLKSKQTCHLYSDFIGTSKSYADSIFLIERFRVYQRKTFYVKYGLTEMALNFLLSFNAKLRFPAVRLILDLIALYLQTLVISFLIVFSRRTEIVETGLAGKFGGIRLSPSFTSYAKNIHRPLASTTNEINRSGSFVKNFTVSIETIKLFRFNGLIILLPTLLIESSLFIRQNFIGGFGGLRCSGTMCVINRFYAVILKANGFSVYLENHGIVRDCVAEYGIYTDALGYRDGIKPLTEE